MYFLTVCMGNQEQNYLFNDQNLLSRLAKVTY